MSAYSARRPRAARHALEGAIEQKRDGRPRRSCPGWLRAGIRPGDTQRTSPSHRADASEPCAHTIQSVCRILVVPKGTDRAALALPSPPTPPRTATDQPPPRRRCAPMARLHAVRWRGDALPPGGIQPATCKTEQQAPISAVRLFRIRTPAAPNQFLPGYNSYSFN